MAIIGVTGRDDGVDCGGDLSDKEDERLIGNGNESKERLSGNGERICMAEILLDGGLIFSCGGDSVTDCKT